MQLHSFPVLSHVSFVVTTFLSDIAVFFLVMSFYLWFSFAWDRHINNCKLLCNPNVDSKLESCSVEINQTPTSDVSHRHDTCSSELCSNSTISWWVGRGGNVDWWLDYSKIPDKTQHTCVKKKTHYRFEVLSLAFCFFPFLVI